MPRRTKLILLGILLLLLAIPIWHAGSNWAPADPLHFRLISRERLPALEREADEDGDGEIEGKDYRRERVEIEVRNTSTAPRFLQDVQVRWHSGKTNTPFKSYTYLVDSHDAEGPVIPPGGTWRGTSLFILPEFVNDDPGYVQLNYYHASTFRRQLLSWYGSFCFHYLPSSQQLRFMIPICSKSSTTLEGFP